MNSKIKVSGSIISELSEKIPSNIIALNELLKNSYDAGAPKVTVTLNSQEKLLIITDTGSGMNKDEIDTLFHISNSTKKYGEINEYGRYTQGAKGLGFLSVFKFGRHVEWKTRKDNDQGYVFRADFDHLVNSSNISEIEIDLVEDDTLEKGTTITISLDDYNAKSLEDYFSIESNYKKIINSFDDKKFEIILDNNGTKHSSNKTTKLLQNVPDRQLYYVKYNSNESKIKFYYNNHEIITHEHKFSANEYTLDVELVLFQFRPYSKEKVDKLFFNPQNDLTPLLYVNSNLFNNYSLFDPNIMKNIKTQLVLNQMIGYVRIVSDNPQINFNSDRTQFLQNEVTDSIKDFLSELNKQIQTVGATHKNYLMEYDFLTVSELPPECSKFTNSENFRKYIKSDFSFRSKVAIDRKDNTVKFSLFGKEKALKIKSTITSSGPSGPGNRSGNSSGNGSRNGSGDNGTGKTPTSNQSEKSIVPATLNLNSDDLKFPVPTAQIDLKQYIASVYDSTSNPVSSDLVKIKIDGVEVKHGVLSSVTEPSKKCIEYSFEDSNTGLIVKSLNVTFFRPSSKITGKNNGELLVTLPSRENYQISYNASVLKLINQLNSLDLNNYLEVIACSLRAGFEMSIDSINKSSKFNNLFLGVNGFENKVAKVIDYIIAKRKYISEISTSSKIDFDSLKNLLNTERFRSGVSTAHLGAHKAGTYVTDTDIKQLASLLGIFVVVVNEMLQNNNIN